jgi:uncharacterized membrane protein
MLEFLSDIHRPLTAAPVTLIVVVVLLELINVARPSKIVAAAARINLLFFFASVTLVFLTGFLAAEKYHALSLSEISFHYNLSRLLIIIAVVCAAFCFAAKNAVKGKLSFLILYYLSLCLMLFITVYTSYAGSLVTKKGCEITCASGFDRLKVAGQ